MGRMRRFGSELGRVFKKLGESTEKTLKSLDNPKMREMDEKLKKAMHSIE